MIRILVTGAGCGVGQGIIKSLRRIDDLELDIIAADASASAAGLFSAGRAALIPKVADPEYFAAVMSLCREEAIDFYIPGTDIELPFCAMMAPVVEQDCGTRIVISSPETIAIGNDKFQTFQFLRRHSLPCPDTWLPDDIDAGALLYPVVVKPRVGSRSIGAGVVCNAEELRHRLSSGRDVVIQEHVGGPDDEFTCTLVGCGKDVSRVAIFRRWLRGGDTYKAESVKSEPIESYILAIAAHLEIEGSCNFQLRLGDDDQPKLFEFNPRCSGTTPLCAMLGFNPLEYYLKHKLGLFYEPCFKVGMLILRHWAELAVPMSSITATRMGRASPMPRAMLQALCQDNSARRAKIGSEWMRRRGGRTRRYLA
jgi:carbamoyl-phosphate synthase large subunit